jgi:glyceraldehyde-3-phosphate dehydrogenase (NADP+)
LPCEVDVAESLVKDERIKMLSFTGSPTVGWELKRLAGKKKVVLELGGNAGVFVDRSADVQEAVKKNLLGAFVYAGQVCIKVQRIFLHEAIYEEYEQSFVEGAKRLTRGDPSLDDTVVGPVINDAARDRIISWVEEAMKLGGTILAGGTVEGRAITPTILANVPRAARVYCQEVFGPVVTLHKVGSVEEAVNGINDSPFGLQAGIFSNDMKNILFAYKHLEVGGVMVNENPTFRVDNMPYGGVKDSGFGREGVKYAIEAMTEPKLLSLSF